MFAQDDNVAALLSLVKESQNLVVLTGAGCSTESGIPDYRDADGAWKHSQPMPYQDFVRSHAKRQRYWARSMIGWQRFAKARPNRAHLALAHLQQAGHLYRLITQNVDGLHQLAGSRDVIDLHGRLVNVICLSCKQPISRLSMQQKLQQLNPDWQLLDAESAPDGDVRLETDFGDFRVPDCEHCNGTLKPDVVFFGENVPAERVAAARQAVTRADGFVVVGSSLMVLSGLRFLRAANERGIPTALVNLGRTRADALFSHRINYSCGDVLTFIVSRLIGGPVSAS